MSDQQATNGYDPERANQVIEQIEALKAEQRRIKREAAAKIAPQIAALSGDIGVKYRQAKKAWGLNTATLKAQIKLRDLQRKQNELYEELDEETQEDLGKLRSDLGTLADLPLGNWFLASKGDAEAAAWDEAAPKPDAKAKGRAGKRKQLNDELDTLGAAGADPVVADNVTKLEAGIRPLKGTKH
jgi:hypothetical protein